jgi:hypothetical protein
MKKQVQLALAGAAVGVVSLVAVTYSATAQVVPFPKMAQGINTWMVRAMDNCNPAGVSVVTTGSPSSGCYQANGGTTDDTLGMKFAKLRVTNRGRIALFARGFTLGDVLRVRLTLRVTKVNISKLHPPVADRVTFADTTVDCPAPASGAAFSARPNGSITGYTTLDACLGPNSGLAKGNIEILDVSLVNALPGGKVVAVPGIFR